MKFRGCASQHQVADSRLRRETIYIIRKLRLDDSPSDREPRQLGDAVNAELLREVHTMHFDGPIGYNQNTEDAVLDEAVIIEFKDKGNETEVDFRHIGIPDDDISAKTHKAGVEESFKLLDRVLEKK